MNAGGLVTAANAAEATLPWVGVERENNEHDATVMLLGWGMEFFWSKNIRPLTDDEALALTAWLITGDSGAAWEREEDDASVVSGNAFTLWSVDDGEWVVYHEMDDDDRRVALGRAPTDRARRVAASRAFLAHLCEQSP